MAETVTITIDGKDYEVPKGMNLVDATKRYAGQDIPVFCYHPKLGDDGNCRMCLVELATPRKSRETGEMELAWFPTLQTACTQTCSEGMTIRTTTDKVTAGRREILEFLLSSHPLDCPICDKGGECPLQNLTMRHGPGTSRMYWDDRMRLGKHIPLGEIIYLDQERCIHCARCTRFQANIADDPVLGFDMRGRKQQIITNSEPGFDSIWSGNTTDICPVGALTTADFRFNARPWEMVQVATVCSHCPVGCNMTFDTRTDRMAGGRTTIKRIMPRQNEAVNEIWICDKGRFIRHYMDHEERLTMPLVRQGGKLVETSWDEALALIADEFKSAGADMAALAGGRLSNEDYFAIQQVVRARGSQHLALAPAGAAGGEFAAQVGVGSGTDLQQLGEGDAILVVASDLHQEAPVWWLRVIAAARRGAEVIVVNGRDTRLDELATHSLRYGYGDAVVTLNAMLGVTGSVAGRNIEGLDEVINHAQQFAADEATQAAAQAFAGAENAVLFVGSEGLTAQDSHNLAQAAANLLLATDHVGRANNGLIVVWPFANGQGASDMGFRPDYLPGYQPVDEPGLDYAGIFAALADDRLKLLWIAGADPVFDDAIAEDAIRQSSGFIIVQDMFLTETAKLANVVLPARSVAEREGTYTSGERRVQRFYPAIEPMGASESDWRIAQMIGEALGGATPVASAPLVLKAAGEAAPQYAGITYPALAKVEQQFPDVSGEDLYFGGTAFTNEHGLGVQWASAAEDAGEPLSAAPAAAGDALAAAAGEGRMVVVPITLIYDREPVVQRTELIQQRVPAPHAGLHPDDAAALGVDDGDQLAITFNEREVTVEVYVDARTPQGVALIPRDLQPQGAPRHAMVAAVNKLAQVDA